MASLPVSSPPKKAGQSTTGTQPAADGIPRKLQQLRNGKPERVRDKIQLLYRKPPWSCRVRLRLHPVCPLAIFVMCSDVVPPFPPKEMCFQGLSALPIYGVLGNRDLEK